MKNILKNDKGINLITLAIAITILVIVTTMLIYNAKDSVHVKELTNMYSDIATLREKISDYYVNYGQIPASVKYENTSKLATLSEVLGANDDQNSFYIIDLSAIDNLTLNFGQDYSEISNVSSDVYNGELDNLYIINKNSHNIFYVGGIEVPQNGGKKRYYTDDENVDVAKVNLRYVDGVKIPDGYMYVEGDKESGIVITKDNKEYVWKVLDEKITSISDLSDSIELSEGEEEKFLESVNAYKGYYKSKTGNEVVYIELKEEWSSTYDVRGTFIDEDENKVYIPKGFQISKKLGENRVNDGLVIRNAETKDEYVWIKVPESAIGVTAVSEVDYDNIEKDLQEYAKDYREDGLVDEWYEGCGLTQEEYTNLKNKMLSSIYANGGFYIGRYEAGLENPKINWSETDTVDDLADINGLPSTQKDKYPYNFITENQAQVLSSRLVKERYKLDENEYKTSLLFGIQWDLVCKFIETTGNKTKDEILEDSTNWANYTNAEFTISRGSHTTDPTQEILWKNDDLPYSKSNSTEVLLTTGATKRNSVLNIYDFAGNVSEWVLEKSAGGSNYTNRGGMYMVIGADYPVEKMDSSSEGKANIGFRVALY